MITLAQAILLLKTYGYLLIFPIAFVEGPIIAVVCGWFVKLGIFNLFVIYIILIVANLLGDAVYYAIGYWGGPPVIRKWGRWIHLDLEETIKLKNHFDKHGGKILLSAKAVPHLATAPVLVGAGLARYNFFVFFRYSLIIEIPKTAIFITLGYFIGDAYTKIAVYFDVVGLIISLVVIAIIVGFMIHLQRQKRYHQL